MTSQPGWDAAYVADLPPPWDIGRPQPVFTRLADQGLLRGRLLDAGCGTGENTMMAAAHGAASSDLEALEPHRRPISEPPNACNP